MGLRYENIASYLIESVPEFKPVLDKHIAEYGELLPHVLFGELTLWTIELFKRWQQTGNPSDYDTFLRLTRFIQLCIDSDDERVNELALFSFLENLRQADRHYQDIRLHLGPKLQHWLDRIERWWSQKRS